jgi:hypothetical protein
MTTQYRRRDDLFIADGLLEPEPSREMSQLLRLLGRFERHPAYGGWSKQRQLWELHRCLYNEAETTLSLIAEVYDEEYCERMYVPLCREVEKLIRAIHDSTNDLVRLGIDVDEVVEPDLTERRRKQHKRRVIIDDDEDC